MKRAISLCVQKARGLISQYKCRAINSLTVFIGTQLSLWYLPITFITSWQVTILQIGHIAGDKDNDWLICPLTTVSLLFPCDDRLPLMQLDRIHNLRKASCLQ